MNIGEKLFELRKSKQLSQEAVAEKLNVTRQTISKWETNQSTPDFDKIIPLCELYGISSDELLRGEINETERNTGDDNIKFEVENVDVNNITRNRTKRALGVSLGVLLYFVAVVWIMISIPFLMLDPILSSAIFLLICGLATFSIVYTCIIYKNHKKQDEQQEKESKIVKQINEVIALVTVIIYLLISFMTMAWHITWIIWVVYGLVEEIVKLIFMLRGDSDEK